MCGMLPVDLWQWDEEWTELYVERSAIMEHDGCLDRRAADFKAQMCVRKMEERHEDMRDMQARPEPKSATIPTRGKQRVQQNAEDRPSIPELI